MGLRDFVPTKNTESFFYNKHEFVLLLNLNLKSSLAVPDEMIHTN